MATIIEEAPPASPPRAASVVVAPAARRYVRPFGPAGPPRTGWRYAGADKRDLRIDLLRGFAVFAMVVDHLAGRSWLHAITGGNRFLVSAAEGFVFLSGLMVGIVYGDRLRRDGLRAVAGKLLARAWTLYALAVWLAIGTAFVAAVLGLPRGVRLTDDPARFVVEVITLRRTFYLVDVMLLYAILLAVSPLALAALRRGGWWVVLIASAALWGAYQAFPAALLIPWKIADNPVFNVAPWQFLFFTGLLIGYGRDWLGRAIGARVPRSPLRDGWATVPVLLFAGLVYLHATNGALLAPLVPGGDTAAWLDFWFDKSALPLPRLAASAVVFGATWLVVTRWWVPIRRAVGWFLLPLGQGALYAYAAHLFLVPAVQAAILAIWGRGLEVNYSTPHPAIDTAIQLAGVLLLWALTRARFLGEIVAPLGRPPFAGARWRLGGIALPRPADSLAAVLVVALVASLLLASGRAPRPAPVAVAPGGAPAAGGAPRPRGAAPPESTVTVPRAVGGNVRGSSGLTGRNDQLTPTVAPAPGAAPTARPSARASAGAAPAVRATPTVAGQPSGGYLRDAEFFSRSLGRTMPYGIYFPPTYLSEPTRRYPVLYMLHGAGGHYSEWVAYGLPEKAEDLFWAGEIQPMIIVMPQGDQSYWANHPDTDGELWGDYVALDLVAHIDATYRTLPQAASRAIGGLSMGGFGALQLAFNYPGIFGTVGAHSPALQEYEQMSDLYADPATYEAFDPLVLARTLTPETAPNIWVDSGADDVWAARTELLAQELDERGISNNIRILPGRHTAEYWMSSIPDYLRFYAGWLVGPPANPRPAR